MSPGLLYRKINTESSSNNNWCCYLINWGKVWGYSAVERVHVYLLVG